MASQYNERLSYEVFADGYDIYDYGHPWIRQHDPYGKVILPEGTYEENAIEHCRQLSLPPEPYVPQPTDPEVLRADMDYMALMLDVNLPSEEEV